MHERDKAMLSESLLGAKLGIVERVTELPVDNIFADHCHMFAARSGDLCELFPDRNFAGVSRSSIVRAFGFGCDPDADLARRKAVFEVFERYAAAIYSTHDTVLASAHELGHEALDWRTFPRLSNLLSDGTWAERQFDPSKEIRWTKGFSSSGRAVFVPLVLSRIHVAPLEGETFCLQTTTGVAAHTSYADAALAALYEVVERDAVETVWTLRTPLPRLVPDSWGAFTKFIPHDEVPYVTQFYFDATRDLDVPTVYAVRQVRPPLGRGLIVSCAASSDIERAALKARIDASGVQLGKLRRKVQRMELRDGLGDRSIDDHDLSSFDFLLSGAPNLARALESKPVEGVDAEARVRCIVDRLELQGREVIFLNLTTDDLAEHGICVVRALVPSLTSPAPATGLSHRSHPRLSEFMLWMGRDPLHHTDINPQSQPFI